MPRKRAEKLSPIPAPRPRKAAKEPLTAGPDAGPDLSHIAEPLRSLAYPLADLAFMVGNAVKHPEKQVEEIRASLRQFGQVEPLVVNRRESPPVVVGGNGRLQAMLAEGYTHGAVCFVDLDRAKANALSVALNRTSDGREWDKVALAELLKDVNTGNDPALDAMLADLSKDLKLFESEPKPDNPDSQNQEPAQPAVIRCPACGHEFDGTLRIVADAA